MEYAQLVDYFKALEQESMQLESLTTSTRHSTLVDKMKQKVEDSRAKALEPLSGLQAQYNDVLGTPPDEIQDKIDEVNKQHDSKLEKITHYSDRFENLMGLSDTKLRILNTNGYENDDSFGTAKGSVDIENDPMYSISKKRSVKENIQDRKLTGRLYWETVFPESEPDTEEVQYESETQGSDKLDIARLYRMTRSALSRSYSRKERKDSLKTLDYQITTHYPNLRSIFMPNLEYSEGAGNTTIVHIRPPNRWEEPQVEEILTNFSRLMLKRGSDIDNSNLGSDLVYTGIFNPDIKKKIEERKLTEKEYTDIEKALNKLPESVPRHTPTSTQTAIQRVEVGKLAVPFHTAQQERYNEISDELLTIETGLSLRVVKSYKSQGLSGSDIVDAQIVMEDQGTNTQTIRSLHSHGIDLEHSELIFGMAKEYSVSIKDLAEKVADELDGDVEELDRFNEELGGKIHEISGRRGMNSWKAFQQVFDIYTGDGGRDIDKTSEILEPGGGRISLTDHPAEDDERFYDF